MTPLLEILRSPLRCGASLLLAITFTLPPLAGAKSTEKEAPLDYGILERSATLSPYMTAPQKIEFLRLQSDLESAESDLRSGHYLINTKPSSFDPDRDTKSIVARGEKLIASAKTRIESTQEALIHLLTRIEAQKTEQLTGDETQFDYRLDSENYQHALTTYSSQLLDACWKLGYKTLFFDGVFVQDAQGTHRAEAHLRNEAYDTLVEIDGFNFTVTIPIKFQLKTDSQGVGNDIFSYENAAAFKDDKKALLAIELIAPEGSSTGLLYLRAIDLQNQFIVAQRLVKISDLATVLGLQDEALADRTPEQLKLRGGSQSIRTLARLAKPYTYEIIQNAETKEVAALLSYTLLNKSGLQLVDSDFIKRSYGASLDRPDAWTGQANAHFMIEATETGGNYRLQVQADGSERVLPAGVLTLDQPAADALADID